MNEDTPTPKCPRCGASVTADAPDGLCPRCLIGLNLSTQTEIAAFQPARVQPWHIPKWVKLVALGLLGAYAIRLGGRLIQGTPTNHVALTNEVRERVLHDPDDQPSDETLTLADGSLSSQLAGAEKLGGGRIRALEASGGELFAEFDDWVSGRWALVTAGLELGDLLPQHWETATLADLQQALAAPTVVPRTEHYGATLYLLPEGLLPMTFGFKTRQGLTGLLQVTGFTDNPHGLKMRYRLALREAVSGPDRAERPGSGPRADAPSRYVTAALARDFGPVIERELPTELIAAENRVLDLDDGRVLSVPTNINMLGLNNPRPLYNWMLKEGADLIVTDGVGHLGFHLDDGRLVQMTNRTSFDGVGVAEVLAQLVNRSMSQNLSVPSTQRGAGEVFAFRTREGGLGVLQILGTTNQPPRVKLRSRLVLAPP